MNRTKQAPPIPYPGQQQRDLVAEAPTTCPTCGGPWRAAKRVCRKCGQTIGRAQRWRLVPAGPGLFAIEHRQPCGTPGQVACNTVADDQARTISQLCDRLENINLLAHKHSDPEKNLDEIRNWSAGFAKVPE